ncbi:hypothetical protein E2C01_083859 [Portunus trituberculatus]|uniref:Uncharacterized protein n=1 Tax=Portunus trituberculatus TaxID=210409 RepID=A0A5B7J957_PORTR|nr:hypothetical protein [Portunus trituberculatus]
MKESPREQGLTPHASPSHFSLHSIPRPHGALASLIAGETRFVTAHPPQMSVQKGLRRHLA